MRIKRKHMVRGMVVAVLLVVGGLSVRQFAERHRMSMLPRASEMPPEAPPSLEDFRARGGNGRMTWDTYAKFRGLKPAPVVEDDAEIVAEAKWMHEMLASGDFDRLEEWRLSVGFRPRLRNWWAETVTWRAGHFARVRFDFDNATTYLLRDGDTKYHLDTRQIPSAYQLLELPATTNQPDSKMVLPQHGRVWVVQVPIVLPEEFELHREASAKFCLIEGLRSMPVTLFRLSFVTPIAEQLQDYLPLIRS